MIIQTTGINRSIKLPLTLINETTPIIKVVNDNTY